METKERYKKKIVLSNPRSSRQRYITTRAFFLFTNITENQRLINTREEEFFLGYIVNIAAQSHNNESFRIPNTIP